MVKFHFKNSTVKLRWILHISVLYIPINMGVPFFFSYKQHIQCILRNYAQWPAMSIMLYMSFLIWFLQQPYNAHVVICVLNKETMVQKVKWYALAHTINPSSHSTNELYSPCESKDMNTWNLKGVAKLP